MKSFAFIAILGILATPFAGLGKPCEPARSGCCATKVAPPRCCQGPRVGTGCDCVHAAQRAPLDRELVAQAALSRPDRLALPAAVATASGRDFLSPLRALARSHDPPAAARDGWVSIPLLC